MALDVDVGLPGVREPHSLGVLQLERRAAACTAPPRLFVVGELLLSPEDDPSSMGCRSPGIWGTMQAIICNASWQTFFFMSFSDGAVVRVRIREEYTGVSRSLITKRLSETHWQILLKHISVPVAFS